MFNNPIKSLSWRKTAFLLLIVLWCLGIVGCGYDGPTISVDDLKTIIEDPAQKITVIDVRPTALFKKGHIPNAVNIPLDDIDKRLSEISRIKGTVAVVCNCGRMTLAAIKILNEKGITVSLVTGGMIAWSKSNYAVEIK